MRELFIQQLFPKYSPSLPTHQLPFLYIFLSAFICCLAVSTYLNFHQPWDEYFSWAQHFPWFEGIVYSQQLAYILFFFSSSICCLASHPPSPPPPSHFRITFLGMSNFTMHTSCFLIAKLFFQQILPNIHHSPMFFFYIFFLLSNNILRTTTL